MAINSILSHADTLGHADTLRPSIADILAKDAAIMHDEESN